MRIVSYNSKLEQSGRKVLWVAVVALVGFICYSEFVKHEVPITRCIGMDPAYDETRSRFNDGRVRNLVYENKNADPQFFSRIVERIGNCAWVKEQKLEKREPAAMSDSFVFGVTDYTEEKLRGSVSFGASGNRFECHVYDHTDFVLVVLSEWW